MSVVIQLSGQCLSKSYSTPVFEEIRKSFPVAAYDTLPEGSRKTIDFVTYDDQSQPLDQGSLILLKRNNFTEVYQVGIWFRLEKGKILGKYLYDSCGFCFSEEYYEHRDTVKTSEVLRSYVTIENKRYESEIIKNYSDHIQTSDAFIIVQGRRKHHGISRHTSDGKVTYEQEFYFGKKVK